MPPSNRPESVEAADFTEVGSSQGSSPAASTLSLGLFCSKTDCKGSRSGGGCSLGWPGEVEEDEEDEEDMGRNQPRLELDLAAWLRY